MSNEFIHHNPLFIQKIKRLLLTNNPSNADLAFQLMKNEGIPKILYPESINTQEKVLLCLKYQLKSPLKLVKFLDLSAYKKTLSNFIHHLSLLENLEYLNLTRQGLANFPHSITELKKLRILHLGANQLSELPMEIINLKNLTHLNLANNIIKDLPNQLGQLVKLEYLTLTSNQIDFIPESLGNLRQLRKMTLWDNPLSKYEIGKLKSLLPQAKIELEINNPL